MPLYVIRLKKQAVAEGVAAPIVKPRLVSATHPSKVAELIVKDFEIERVDAKEAYRLGVEEQVKIEEA